MAHEKKVKLPQWTVMTTDGDQNTTFHGASSDRAQVRKLKDDNPGSVAVKTGHVDASFDKPEKVKPANVKPAK